MTNLHLEPLGGGIKIYVSDSYHFSTDTILLADFSLQTGAKKCAELGTGCGTIPLLWLKRNPKLTVDAVELQPEACEMAQKSAELNGFDDRLHIHCRDLKDINGELKAGSYDLVACNPPYKPSGSGIPNPESKKLLARHEAECTLDDICECAARLLQFGGRLCICQRPERLADAVESMRRFGVEPKTLRLVQQRQSKPPKLFLLEGRRGGSRGFLKVLPTLFIEDGQGGFSDEMLKIYGDYKSDHTKES